MESNLTSRKTYAVSLSYIALQDNILHPELLALKLDSRVTPVDIGALVYSVRKKMNSRYLVSPQSLVPSRRKLLISLMDLYYVRGMSHETIRTELKYFEMALDWCDSNGFSDVFCDAASARTAYMSYSNFLYQEIITFDSMAPGTGQARQRMLKRAIELQYEGDAEYILAAVSNIQTRRDGLAPPEEEEVARYVDISLVITLNFSRFLVNGTPFPMRLDTNEYHTYIFPGHGKYITPLTEGRHERSAYDYQQGRIKSISELMRERPETRLADLRSAIHSAEELVEEVNADLHHPFRLRLATLVMRGFASLINLVVGANSGELVQFLFEDALEVVKSPLKKELSAIKLRAKGLEVSYTIGRGPGMELLREYLRFREWVLDGRESEFLFFTPVAVNYTLHVPGQLEKNFSSKFFKRLKGVFVPEDARNIPPLLVRKHKSLILHQLRHSPLLVSAVLNHTERTNVAYYSGATVAGQKAEFENYWAAVKKAAERIKNSANVPGVSTTVGHCDEMDSPEKDIPVVAIEPDCNSQYGCLFCVHYVVHSDETDIHKLVSFLYIIDGIRANAPNFSFSEEVFKDVVIRIDFILDAISERSHEARDLVATVKKKVFNLGILTPFWEKRLQRYEKMGIYI